jgi:putative small multi-drug export protein
MAAHARVRIKEVSMIDRLIDVILQFLINVFVHPEIVTVLIAVLPIVEARMAVPIGLGLNLGYFQSWLFAFIGSSLIAPLLLLALIPFIKWLSRTRLFKKIGTALYDKFEKKSRSVKGAGDDAADGKESGKKELKKMLGVFLFVAIPLPLTGVWTGCAVASILKIKYWKALVSVVGGNLVASLIILVLCRFFEPYINYIILALGIIAVVIVIVLIVKIILHKPEEDAQTEPSDGK